MIPRYPNRVNLALLPTPVQPMDRLSRRLNGPQLFIKRDDQTGLATGGNKTRKLEFLVADALAQGCDHLITTGGPLSNHCRQTAAAAAQCGLGCSLVLRGAEPAEFTGNLLLDRLLGAHIYWTKGEALQKVISQVSSEVTSMGRQPYVIPLGGSNVMGATSYVMAMQELMEQLATLQINIDFIVVPSSSGGTQAGLVLGAAASGYRGKILGISIDQEAGVLQTQVAALATATATHLGLEPVTLAGLVEVNDDYLGGGYGVVCDGEREAIETVAQTEGILLDPVYTARAMAGLIDLIRWGAFTRGQRILFWHTGGIPNLFSYTEKLLSP
jgi:D-cysteine desulfhydrase family pyridoxal phosphate-dependent enzyme